MEMVHSIKQAAMKYKVFERPETVSCAPLAPSTPSVPSALNFGTVTNLL